jgi:tRNA(fMet)-specific endonuclease VapC
VKYLLDTDHISILQKQAGPEFAALAARVGRHDPDDLAFSVVSLHEQMLGCHTYISRAQFLGSHPRLWDARSAPS